MSEDSTNNNNKYFCLRCKDRNWLIECSCGVCGDILSRTDNRYRIRNHIYGHWGKEHNKGEKCIFYKNGRTINADGYGILSGFKDHPNSDSKGNILEHVYNFTQHNKCCMLSWGHVHHIIPIDKGGSNLPYNLLGMTNKQHQLLHHEKDTSDWRCEICGTDSPSIRKETGKPRWGYINGKRSCNKCYSRWYEKNRRKLINISS